MSPWILTCCSGDAIWWILIWKICIWTHFSLIGKNKAHTPSDICQEVGGICSVGWCVLKWILLNCLLNLELLDFGFMLIFSLAPQGKRGGGRMRQRVRKEQYLSTQWIDVGISLHKATTRQDAIKPSFLIVSWWLHSKEKSHFAWK